MIFAERYKLLALIGQGGMGQVYRAEHLALRRHVALKIIKAAFVGEREQRFAREAATLARLDHRGIVRILDYGRAGKHLFIAMELVEGRSLAQVLIEEGALASTRAIRYARGVLDALAHAHANGVLHRDIKPANVMIGNDGRVVVIDFGLARALDDAALTARGQCYGSPSYLAPERFLADKYDERADLYSVGVLLYEMLANELPYPGGRRAQPARPLRVHRPDLARSLDIVVTKAMAADPARRFADADDMYTALAEPTIGEYEAAGATMLAIEVHEEISVERPSWLRRTFDRLLRKKQQSAADSAA